MNDLLYQPLSVQEREIRVLSLLPGSWNDSIRCLLSTVSLDDDPEYDALSYVWGERDSMTLISVNDNNFQVTPNLWAALRRLRSTDEVCRIWADAICINQHDVKEREHQVTLMGAVYSNCIECFIWLGEEDDFPLPYRGLPDIHEYHSDHTIATFEKYI